MQGQTDYLKTIGDCLAGRLTNRHACMLFINFPFIHSVTGVELHSYFHDAQVMMEAQVDTWRALGVTGYLWPDLGVVPECQALGAKIKYDEKGFPSVEAESSLEIDAFLNRQPADPYGGNMLTDALNALEYMQTHKPAGFQVHSSIVQSAFTGAAMLRGISEFCMDFIDEPEKAQALMDVVLETDIRYMKAQEAILGKLDYILLSDDISAFLSLGQFEQLVMPYYQRFFAPFPDSKRWLHNDAQALHLAPALKKCGLQLWHTGSCFDSHKAMETLDDSVFLVGNLNPVELSRMTSRQAYDAAAEEIRSFNGNTKFILGLGGFISYGTPAENIRSVLAAASDTIIKEI